MLSVDHFSTRTDGGAGGAARRLHEDLVRAGVESRFVHWRRADPPTPNARRMVSWSVGPWPWRTGARVLGRVRRRSIKARLRAARRGAPSGLELFTAPLVGWRTPFSRRVFGGSVAHLHWVAGLIDHPSFFASLPAGHPVVWTLHDMNPFTGGCHFSGGCERFTDGCGMCPQLGRPAEDDLSGTFHEIKRRSLTSVNLHVVAPSRWILALARQSPVFGEARTFRVIPNGVDTNTYRPVDRRAACKALGLDPDRPVVAIGADRLDMRRKGMREGAKALMRVASSHAFQVLGFGNQTAADWLPTELDLHPVGFVHDPDRLASVYAAADCFVLPSLEDNLPATGIEALACGTPVVAFATGGIVDYVLPGQTGLLARTGDAAELARQVEWMLSHSEERREMGARGRQLVLDRFTVDRQVDAHIALYRELSGRADGR